MLSLRACEAISLFGLSALNNRDRHASLAMTGLRRDRRAPLALLVSLRACEAISLFDLSALNNRDRRAALAMTGLRRDRHAPRAHCAALPMTRKCDRDERIIPHSFAARFTWPQQSFQSPGSSKLNKKGGEGGIRTRDTSSVYSLSKRAH